MKSRTARLELQYDGTDISASVAEHVVRVNYKDNDHGKADDLRVTMEDRDELWKGGWYPRKGAALSGAIVCENWLSTGGAPLRLPIGRMEIDEVEAVVTPEDGDTVVIKACSVPITKSIRKQRKNRTWENTTFAAVAGDIAQKHGLKLKFEGDSADFARLDQRGQSDLEFITALGSDHGKTVRVVDGILVILDGVLADAAPSSGSIVRGSTDIRSLRIKDKLCEVYKSCRVKYHDPQTKEFLDFEFAPAGAPPSGSTLQSNCRAKSLAEAEQLARAALRKNNKLEKGGSITLMGNPGYRAGQIVTLSGFRNLDGRYKVETASHAFGRMQGYTTDINLAMTLEY